MNDERLQTIIAAVEARFPGARVELGLDPWPGTARTPVFTILLDADVDTRHAAQALALQMGLEAFGREELPYVVSAVTPQTWAEYKRDVAEALAQEAASKS